ncbi:MAG: hypothetical protein US98_C0047G0001 [Parcubacteria group bacterium GW2011_GWC1_38_6]|nr:MAG: hypothetical protein US98_C0047G0001 [Parcubacteria group bacterium GW2011_GWC1_38_6]
MWRLKNILFFRPSEFDNQKAVAPNKAPIHTPVIESSTPTHLVKVIPAAAPATHKGQWAKASGGVNNLTTNKDRSIKDIIHIFN